MKLYDICFIVPTELMIYYANFINEGTCHV